jgi:hypothetical protein
MAKETLRFQPAGLPWRRFSASSGCALRDLPISFFHRRPSVSASFFHRKRKVQLFINAALFQKNEAQAIFRDACGKREDPPGWKGQPHTFSAAGVKSRRQPSKTTRSFKRAK